MKHIHRITRTPAQAELWQEILCQANHALALFLDALGGSSPKISYIEGKCDLPTT